MRLFLLQFISDLRHHPRLALGIMCCSSVSSWTWWNFSKRLLTLSAGSDAAVHDSFCYILTAMYSKSHLLVPAQLSVASKHHEQLRQDQRIGWASFLKNSRFTVTLKDSTRYLEEDADDDRDRRHIVIKIILPTDKFNKQHI